MASDAVESLLLLGQQPVLSSSFSSQSSSSSSMSSDVSPCCIVPVHCSLDRLISALDPPILDDVDLNSVPN